MNLFFKSYRNYLIFFILITCESSFNRGIAQDESLFPRPWIQEINLPEIYADIPNSSFYLDESGTLFLGKDNGLSVIGEEGFYHLHMPGPVYVSGNASDTIFYACENDMGFLLRDKSDSYTIRSQRDRITRATRNFIPRRLICMNGSAFVNTNRGVYQNTKGRVKYHPFPDNEGRLLRVRDELFLRMSQEEIFIWQGEKFQKLTDGEITQNVPLRFPAVIENLDSLAFIDYISDREALGLSAEYGMVILDKDGMVSTAPGKNSGLPDQDIRQIIAKSSGEIWILGSHSLHKLNHPATLNILDLSREDIGQIYTSSRVGKGMFLGTSKGLFLAEPLLQEEGPWKIRHIAGNKSESFRLLSHAENTIFAAGSGQLIAVRNEMPEDVSAGNFTGILALSGEELVASGQNGLLHFESSPKGWIKKTIKAEQKNAFSFQSFEEQVFMICNNEIYSLNKSTGTGKVIPFHREELLHKLIRVRNILYLISDIGVYRYEKSEENFLPLENDEEASLLSSSDLILSDKISGLWLVQHLGHYRSKVIQRVNGESSGSEDRLYPILETIGEILEISCRDSMIYLTCNNKIALLNLKTLKNDLGGKPPVIRIINDERKSAFSKGSVRIQLSGLYFQSTPEPEFRFSFDPDNEGWSGWSQSNILHFSRLNPGSYTLYAQSMDLFGRISEPAEIQFSIKSPIYRSWFAYIFYAFVLFAGLFLIRKLRLLSYRLAESRVSQRMQRKLDDLTSEKEKSDKIVADILPDRTAQQMRLGGKAKWDKYERATVLFSDIQGFTKIAEEMNPEALIDELDQFFFHFDSVVEKYNIEKIKTIGDAYMAAGGIPEKNSTNPVEVVLAALEMQAYMQRLKSTKADIWDLRIGVHTGPVIAGVVGHKKVSYDIWGDTVNTASRMESSGIPGKVNISGITYGMVKDYFLCEYRGKLPVKYKGKIDMYFVTGLRPELAVDLKGIPNKRFFTKLQILRLNDLEDRVFETILKNLPEKLHFHDLEYARKVYNQTFLLVRAEEVEQQDRLIVRTAALMLYTGLTQAYTNYENRSSVIARDILPEFQYSESQIDKICNLIMSTKLPFQPNNQLEKILIDSKMEYIGKPDYPVRIKELHREMVENGINLNGQQFKKQQLELLYTFDYFTVAARRLREVSGEAQQSSLEQERWI